MAELSEAFFYIKDDINLVNIDYFFTQRNMKESHEYLDKNMNRKNKQVNIIYNFLAICIPIYNNDNNDYTYNIQIFGDSGYHYKGSIKSFQGIVPNFMIPIKGDKKLFVHVNYKFADSDENSLSKKFVNFIDVPKRFQMQNDNENDTDSQISKTDNQEINI